MAEFTLNNSGIEGELHAGIPHNEEKISELSYTAVTALIGGDKPTAGEALSKIIEILYREDPDTLLRMLENSDERGKAIAEKIRNECDSRCLG